MRHWLPCSVFAGAGLTHKFQSLLKNLFISSKPTHFTGKCFTKYGFTLYFKWYLHLKWFLSINETLHVEPWKILKHLTLKTVLK